MAREPGSTLVASMRQLKHLAEDSTYRLCHNRVIVERALASFSAFAEGGSRSLGDTSPLMN
jgi:hypothetical protein